MTIEFGRVAETLAVDAQTAKVVTALRASGIEPILLKGAAVAAWLYRDGTVRTYGDTDLLIPAAARAETAEILSGLGYVGPPTLTTFPTPATHWVHERSGLEVDLHTRLWGWDDRRDLWIALQPHTISLPVGGASVRVLDDAAKAVHVVAHAVQHMLEGEQANADLDRALAQVPDEIWGAASTVAHEVGAWETFVVGLHTHSQGASLCQRFGWTVPEEIGTDLHLALSGSLYSGAQHLEILLGARGVRVQARVLLDRVLPPVSYARSKVDSAGTRGDGVIRTYLRYWGWMLGKAPTALRALRMVRHDSET